MSSMLLITVLFVTIIFLLAILVFKSMAKKLNDDHLLQLNPLKETLEKFEAKIHDIEKNRVGSYEGLTQQVKSLLNSQLQLGKETANLSKALRTPSVRGRWGELQLKRIVELSGMLAQCDFYEQPTSAQLRPDLLIKLPQNKNILVDAKVPLTYFLDALEHTDEQLQKNCLANHARLVREHIKKLSQKNYWEAFNPTPEFVILFLPNESFFSAALEYDPELIEFGIEKHVILATPTTLIALLKAVSYGWMQESITKDAEQIHLLGKELSKRLTDMHQHFYQIGDKLHKTVEAYNKTLASFESRVLVSARKFQALNHHPETEVLTPLDISPREL